LWRYSDCIEGFKLAYRIRYPYAHYWSFDAYDFFIAHDSKKVAVDHIEDNNDLSNVIREGGNLPISALESS
jgi:hypothetical protein